MPLRRREGIGAIMARLLFVIQRFGPDVLGGAERLAWRYACLLSGRGHRVEVATTCARDYMTWADEFAPGTAEIAGAGGVSVCVHRFAVAAPRDVPAFNRLSRAMARSIGDHSLALRWMRAQGPDAPGLEAFVARDAASFDAVLLFGYLYLPTWLAMPHVADRAILIPFAHAEWTLGIAAYRSLFSGAAVVGTSSQAEEELLRARFGAALPPDVLRLGAGCDTKEGVESPEEESPGDLVRLWSEPEFHRSHGDRLERGDYILCLGRQTEAKNTHLAFALWARAFGRSGSGTQPPLLVVAGPVEAGFRPPAHYTEHTLHIAEAVPAGTAATLRGGALATLHLSANESLNLEALASLAAGTPLLVAEESAATLEFVERARTGILLGAVSPEGARHGDLAAKLRRMLALDHPLHPAHAHTLDLAAHILRQCLPQLRDAAWRAQARENCQRRAAGHTWEAVTDRLELAIERAARAAERRRAAVGQFLPVRPSAP